MMVSHVTNHAAGGFSCQPNSVRAKILFSSFCCGFFSGARHTSGQFEQILQKHIGKFSHFIGFVGRDGRCSMNIFVGDKANTLSPVHECVSQNALLSKKLNPVEQISSFGFLAAKFIMLARENEFNRDINDCSVRGPNQFGRRAKNAGFFSIAHGGLYIRWQEFEGISFLIFRPDFGKNGSFRKIRGNHVGRHEVGKNMLLRLKITNPARPALLVKALKGTADRFVATGAKCGEKTSEAAVIIGNELHASKLATHLLNAVRTLYNNKWGRFCHV